MASVWSFRPTDSAKGKWLRAGVLENGCVYHPETGVPQGGGISPLLANVYLHEVLDRWFEETVKPRLKGRAELVRYADDFVRVCGSPGSATARGHPAHGHVLPNKQRSRPH